MTSSFCQPNHPSFTTIAPSPYFACGAQGLDAAPEFAWCRPPTELRESIAFFWSLRVSSSTQPIVETVVPDGDTDFIYRVGDLQQSLIRGPQRRVTSASIDSKAHYVGVRLRTPAARKLTGLSAAELLDHRIPNAPLNSELAEALQRSAGVRENAKVFAALIRMLRELLRNYKDTDGDLASTAAGLIQRSGGTSQVQEVARWLGCSDRHLHRTLTATTGLSPKEYARVVRFQQALRLVTHSSRSLAEIAHDLDYTDQAHMTREFVAIANRTPLTLRHTMSVTSSLRELER